MWNEVQTFAQLQTTMLSLLSGDIEDNPWSEIPGPNGGINLYLLDKLQELCRSGYVVTEAHVGRCLVDGVITRDSRSRGLLVGFMRRDLLEYVSNSTLAVFAYDFTGAQLIMNDVADQLVADTADGIITIAETTRPVRVFNSQYFGYRSINDVNVLSSRVHNMIYRDTYYVAIIEPTFCTTEHGIARVDDIANHILRIIRPDNPQLQNLDFGPQRNAANGPIRLDHAFDQDGVLIHDVIGTTQYAHWVQSIYHILMKGGVRAPRVTVLARAFDIADAYPCNIAQIKELLAPIDAEYLLGDILTLWDVPIGLNADPSLVTIRSWIDDNVVLTDQAYNHLTRAVKEVYKTLVRWGAVPIGSLARAISIVNEAGRYELYEDTVHRKLDALGITATEDKIREIAHIILHNSIPHNLYGTSIARAAEAAEAAEAFERFRPAATGIGTRIAQAQLAQARRHRQRRPAPAPAPVPVPIPAPAPVPALKVWTTDEVEAYYRAVLGDDYRQLVFDDIFGDPVNVGAFIDESPDNMVAKAGDVWFATQKSGVRNLDVIRPGSLATGVSPFNEYISIGGMGCPCLGIADYNAVMSIVNSNLQIILFRMTSQKIHALSDYMTYYETYQPTNH